MVVEVEEITEEEMDVVVENEDDTEDSVVAVESVVDVVDLVELETDADELPEEVGEERMELDKDDEGVVLEGRVVVVIPDPIVLAEYK